MNRFLKTYRRELWIGLLLIAAVWAVFGQTAGFEFINYDDPDYVYESPAVLRGLTPDGVKHAFTSRLADGWYPLTALSLMLDGTLYGTSPGGYHVTNVLLHTAAVLALFLALRSLTGSIWRSALVAALFAVHPLRAESVAWVSARKDVLSGLFFFLTLWAYARYGMRDTGRASCSQRAASEARARAAAGPPNKICPAGGFLSFPGPFSSPWYWAVMVLFACALMSKPTVVPLPFLLLVLDFWPLRRMARKAEVGVQRSEIRGQESGVRGQKTKQQPLCFRDLCGKITALLIEKFPLFLLMAAVVVITPAAEKAALRTDELPFSIRAGNACRSYAVYMLQTVRPAKLSPFYVHAGRKLPVEEAAGGLAVVAAVSAAVFLLRRRQPALLTGWLWYLGMLVPVIGIILAGAQAHADRYTYLPHPGLLIVFVWAAADAAARLRMFRAVRIGAAAFVIAAAAAAGARQTAVWRGSDTVWSHALKYDSYNLLACNNLGTWLMMEGRIAEAEVYFDRAIKAHPGYRDALYNRGNAAVAQGRLEEAISYFERAAQTDPNYYASHQNMGTAYLQSGQPDRAVACYERALQLRPGDPVLTGLLQKARAAQAQQRFSARIAGLNREAAQAQSQGDLAGAAALYRQALRLQPDFVPALNNLAWILATGSDASLRSGAEAVELAEKACELTTNGNPGLLDTLAAAYAEAGRFDEAVKTAGRAAQLAREGGNEAQAQKIETRLELYRRRQPFRL